MTLKWQKLLTLEEQTVPGIQAALSWRCWELNGIKSKTHPSSTRSSWSYLKILMFLLQALAGKWEWVQPIPPPHGLSPTESWALIGNADLATSHSETLPLNGHKWTLTLTIDGECMCPGDLLGLSAESRWLVGWLFELGPAHLFMNVTPKPVFREITNATKWYQEVINILGRRGTTTESVGK